MRHCMHAAASVGLSLFITANTVAGDLTPPAGPVDSTMKTLAEVEPRIPVQSVPGGGTIQHVISEPGSYYLAGDIIADVPTVIRILTGDVTLDLMGFTIKGGANTNWGIHVDAPDGVVVIRNGHVRNSAQWGVQAVGNARVELENLRVDSCGFYGIQGNPHIVIRNCSVSNTVGIQLTTNAFVENVVSINNNFGLATGAYSYVTRSKFSGNIAEGLLLGVNCHATDCNSSQNGGHGIVAAGVSVVERCVSTDNNGFGMTVTNRCRVVGNQVSFNDAGGMLLQANGNYVAENNALANGGNAFQSQFGPNLFVRNTVNGFLANAFVLHPSDLAQISVNSIGTDPNTNIVY